MKIPLAPLAAALALITASAVAQKAPTGFEVVKITPELLRTPDVSFSGGPTGRKVKGQNFLGVEVAFSWQPREAKPAYLDEITVNYYILLNNAGANPESPQAESLLTGSVTHISVPQDKDLKSVMYVSPRTLAKLFNGKVPSNINGVIKDVGATITRGGEVVAQASMKGDIKNKTPWWASPTQAMTPTPGYLLNKNQTPFAPLVWEYYEEIKAGQ